MKRLFIILDKYSPLLCLKAIKPKEKKNGKETQKGEIISLQVHWRLLESGIV